MPFVSGFICDKCGDDHVQLTDGSITTLRERARSYGWSVSKKQASNNYIVLCPKCRRVKLKVKKYIILINDVYGCSRTEEVEAKTKKEAIDKANICDEEYIQSCREMK